MGLIAVAKLHAAGTGLLYPTLCHTRGKIAPPGKSPTCARCAASTRARAKDRRRSPKAGRSNTLRLWDW